MANYVVLTTILDEIDDEAGYRPDGSPNRMMEWKEGDVVTLPNVPPERIQVLLDLHCIEEESAEKERESSEESTSETPNKAQGATKKAT